MKSMRKGSTVAILASCAGYGAYIPALRLANELQSQEVPSKIYVYEDFFGESEKDEFLDYRKQFHESFRFAQMASKVSSTIEDACDYQKIQNRFEQDGCGFFIPLIGSWLLAMEAVGIARNRVLCLRPDVSDSPSWQRVSQYTGSYETIWLLGKDGALPEYMLCRETFVREPASRILMHGGGWGIANFIPAMDKLQKSFEPYAIYSTREEAEASGGKQNGKSFYTPIDWLPGEQPSPPPLIDIEKGTSVLYEDLVRSCCAVVSKPGGGTCLDAFLMKVPPVFLQGMARHEKDNSEHMIQNGLAIAFQDWESENFSKKTLLKIRNELIRATQDKPYIADYIKKRM